MALRLARTSGTFQLARRFRKSALLSSGCLQGNQLQLGFFRTGLGRSVVSHSTISEEPISNTKRNSFKVAHGGEAYCPGREHVKCWNCCKPYFQFRYNFFCPICNVVQPPPKEQRFTFFDLLEIDKPTFDIDTDKMEQKYKELQKTIHPDMFHKRTPSEQNYSLALSGLLNDAYATLRRPLTRAKYMLYLSGMDIDELTKHVDPGFLLDVMSVHEALEKLPDASKLQELVAQVESNRDSIIGDLSTQFKSHNLNQARILVSRLAYVEKLLIEIRERL